MTTYVIRYRMTGEPVLVERRYSSRTRPAASSFPAPNVSRFESYQSPIDDRTISSDRQRELDLFNSGSYDERDVGPTHPIAKAKKARKEANAARPNGPEQPDFWR